MAVGILTVLFNRQILRYLGTNALAVYGIIVNISSFVQCCAYSVGQAAQPIISMNLGAKLGGRGLVLSGILIFILPVIAGANAIWFAMPVTELIIAVFVVVLMIRYTRQLPIERKISQ